VGRVEGSKSVKKRRGEMCVWDEGNKEEKAKKVEVVY
jgi:hypothetical protein